MSCNLLDVSHLLMGVLINILLQKIEEEVSVEEYFYCLVPSQMKPVIRLLKRYIKECCEAGVSNQKEDKHIKVTFPSTVRADDDLVLPWAFLSLLSSVTLTVIFRIIIWVWVPILLNIFSFGLLNMVNIISLEKPLSWSPPKNCPLLSILKKLEVSIQLLTQDFFTSEYRYTLGI